MSDTESARKVLETFVQRQYPVGGRVIEIDSEPTDLWSLDGKRSGQAWHGKADVPGGKTATITVLRDGQGWFAVLVEEK